MQIGNKTNIQPKTVYYYSNGTGRDSYIMKDNAGFARPSYRCELPDKYAKHQSMNFSNKSKQQMNLFSVKTNHYFSDGTGRDNYITINEGGQIQGQLANTNLKNKAFQLRSYQKSEQFVQDDHFMKSQRLFKSNAVAQQILKQRQIELTETLSQPKNHKYVKTNKLSSLKYDTSLNQQSKQLIK